MEEVKNIAEMAVVKLAAVDTSPAFPKITVNKTGGFVSFGPRNDYPQYVINLNSKSPVNTAIIDSTVTYICGKGVRDSSNTRNKFVGVPNPTETWDDLTEKVARDYKTFGGFYLQVIKNKDSETVSVYHQDFTTVRIETVSSVGDPLTWVISNEWPKAPKSKRVGEIPTWKNLEDMEDEQVYMFYHWDYMAGLFNYCLPDYYAAQEYIKADGTLAEFYNNSIDNGFIPSVVISMPSNPSFTDKAEFQKKMEGAFSGAKGAASIVILWGENKDVKPEITPYSAAANANVYNDVEKIVFQKIMTANRLTSPTLAGVSGSGNLSGNAQEIVDAYILYNYTVIEKKRRKILDKLNIFTKINGTRALEIDELDVLPKIKETQSTEAIPTLDGEVESLASKLGVGGMQALTAIMESPNMDEEGKRGMLKTVFGISDEDLDILFAQKARATLKRRKPLTKFMDKLNQLMTWK